MDTIPPPSWAFGGAEPGGVQPPSEPYADTIAIERDDIRVVVTPGFDGARRMAVRGKLQDRGAYDPLNRGRPALCGSQQASESKGGGHRPPPLRDS